MDKHGRRSVRVFAGLYALDDERLLAATTDGVGNKLSLARRTGRLRDVGADLGAHVNDVITTGADPLFFLDYVAAGVLGLRRLPTSWRGSRPSAGRPAARSSAARPRSCRASTARASSTSRERASDSCGARS